jgi:hypothetical protein
MRSAPSSTTRRAWAALGSGLLLLSGCGAGEGEFAPACPRPSIPRDFNDLHRFRNNGRDLTDSVLEGRITGVSGSCKRTGDNTVTATVSVGLDLTRGPAAPGREADVGYFVAVTEGERILDKQVFRLRAEFPANTDRLRLTGDEVELKLPVTPQKTAAAYQVLVGFDLTPAELQLNRQRIDQRTR